MERVDEEVVETVRGPGDVREVGEVAVVAHPPGSIGSDRVELSCQAYSLTVQQGIVRRESTRSDHQLACRLAAVHRVGRAGGGDGVPADGDVTGNVERGAPYENAVDLSGIDPDLQLRQRQALARFVSQVDGHRISVRDVNGDLSAIARHCDDDRR